MRRRNFKLRSKGGFGVGNPPRRFVPDGIDLKLHVIAAGAPAAVLVMESPQIEEMAWRMAAILEAAQHFDAKPVKGVAVKKEWRKLAEEARDGAIELARNAGAKNAGGMIAAAVRTQAACVTCHVGHRE